MSYDFHNLSDVDFEDLSRELIGAYLGCRFEAFGPGPDGGIDGRHSVGSATTILQAKHYLKSRMDGLKRAVAKEAIKIAPLAPSRYILTTTKSLLPKNKAMLANELGAILKNTGDIFGKEDINGLLRVHPHVERAHIKLWLSQSAVFERLLRSDVFNYTATSRTEIETKVKVYAQNPSLKKARDILEKQHVLIVSGPPGIGKTTLAEMLTYSYIGEEWEFIAVKSLDDGFGTIVDTRKQIFLFDDFLGRVKLDVHGLAAKDSQLAQFIKRVRGSKNARFILTTRSYIFEHAKRISEHLADTKVNLSQYILDVGVYTRRIRARILYNHLSVSNIPKSFVKALVRSGQLSKIIDHLNYNPRIIEWMTDSMQIGEITAKSYPSLFMHTLDNPDKIWDTAFRTHILPKCRHLIYALYFCSEFGVENAELREAFDSLHLHLCKKYGIEFDPKDFEEAVRILEGSFIKIYRSEISFINPSLRDYLSSYLNDKKVLLDFWPGAYNASWAESLTNKIAECKNTTKADLKIFAEQLLPLARRFDEIEIWKPNTNDPHLWGLFDINHARRIRLLITWWEQSDNIEFLDIAARIAASKDSRFSGWNDAYELVFTLVTMNVDDKDLLLPLRAEVDQQIQRLLKRGMALDDLSRVTCAINSDRDYLSEELFDCAQQAATEAVSGAVDEIDMTDSTSTLDDMATALLEISTQFQVNVDRALNAIQARQIELEEMEIVANEPSFTANQKEPKDVFTDDDLTNLFAPLLAR